MKPSQFVIGTLIALSLTTCSEDTWEGFFYPDRNNLSRYVDLGEFSSLEACRFAINEHAQIKRISEDKFDYECGKNCKPMDGGLKICSETKR